MLQSLQSPDSHVHCILPHTVTADHLLQILLWTHVNHMVHAGLFKRIFLELPCLSLPPLQPTPFLLLTFISLLFFLFPQWHCLYPARRFGQHCQLTSNSRQNPAAKCLLLHLELKNYHAICDTKSTNNRLFVSQLELTSTSIHILIAQICVHSCIHIQSSCTFCVELHTTKALGSWYAVGCIHNQLIW